MKALTRTQYGGPENIILAEIPKPTIKSDEVLVNVKVCTINRTDCGILWAKPFPIRLFTGLTKPKHLIPGTDYSGIVTEVGSAVKEYTVGDRVWGFYDEGLQSHADYVAIKANTYITKIPENISFEEAVASGEGAHYAINFINKIDLQAGDKVLVYGATGAIGSAAVQILKARDIFVTAVANTQNMAKIKALGVDRIYDYLTQDWTGDELKYDFVFDAVGKSSFGICKPLLKKEGAYISSELGPGNQNLYLPLLTRFSSQKVIFPIPKDTKASMLIMNDLLRKNQYKPLIERSYSLEDIVDAYTYVQSGQKTGNVLLKIS